MSATDLLIALNLSPAIPRSAACRLARELTAWAGQPSAGEDAGLARRLGVPPEVLRAACALRREAPALAAGERRRASELGAEILTTADAGYPAALLHLSLPPPVLYLSGRLPEGPAVTLVGSRRADPYGLEVAELFGRELAAAGAVVVSGFARGIDAAAHRGALAAEGGRTVAVLGCGLGVAYPTGHCRLGRAIALRGALLTEFPVGAAPAAWQFPVRNRILAALSQATLVVRAAARSGSLITARQALELGRDVYAVPGRIFETGSFGPHGLIREGAHLVQHPREILENLVPPLPPAAGGTATSGEGAGAAPPGGESLLAALPPAEPRTPEEVAAATGEPIGAVMAGLLELELAGHLRRLPGGAYYRRL